jgi:hypothetical protein
MPKRPRSKPDPIDRLCKANQAALVDEVVRNLD